MPGCLAKRRAKNERKNVCEAKRRALAELQREIQVRNVIYPKLVHQGKLSEAEANARMGALALAVALVTEAPETVMTGEEG